jgi:hypothetical protein
MMRGAPIDITKLLALAGLVASTLVVLAAKHCSRGAQDMTLEVSA